PAMTPLHETRASADVLLQVGNRLGLGAKGLPPGNLQAFSRKRAVARATELGALPPDGERALFMRGVAVAAAKHEPRPISVEAIGPILQSASRNAAPASEPALFTFPTALAPADPRAPSWLREVPDAVSGVCWSSWVELSPADAARIGARDGDFVALTTLAGEAHLPLSVYAGLRDGVVAVPADAPELRLLQGALAVRELGPG